MRDATPTNFGIGIEALVRQIIGEVVERIDWSQIKPAPLTYSEEDLVEQCGFKNKRSVQNARLSGLLIGTKVGGKWRFTRENVVLFLKDSEVTV